MKKLFVVALLLTQNAYAEEVVTHSGSTYHGCSSIGNTSVFLTNPNDYSTIKPGYIYLPNGCKSLPAVPAKYLKVENGSVAEMTQSEKDAVDAPDLAAATLISERETLLSQIEADDTNWASMTTAQRLAVAKKLLRLEVLKKRLGGNS